MTASGSSECLRAVRIWIPHSALSGLGWPSVWTWSWQMIAFFLDSLLWNNKQPRMCVETILLIQIVVSSILSVSSRSQIAVPLFGFVSSFEFLQPHKLCSGLNVPAVSCPIFQNINRAYRPSWQQKRHSRTKQTSDLEFNWHLSNKLVVVPWSPSLVV